MLATVQGNTDVYLIPGDPVEQVRAPDVFNLIFRTLGINAVLVPVHVAAGDIETFVRAAFLAKNIKGMFLAIPHKSLVMGLLSHCNDYGRVAGAVNGIRRNPDGKLEGGLFDGKGFVSSLDYFGVAYAGKRVLVLGAGGGASAIAASLAIAGSRAPAEIALYDPVPGKAQAIAAHRCGGLGVTEKFEVVRRLLDQHFKAGLGHQSAAAHGAHKRRGLVLHEDVDHGRMRRQARHIARQRVGSLQAQRRGIDHQVVA